VACIILISAVFRVTLKQLELDHEAKKAGITAILGCGCALGITNILAMHGANKLDKVDSVYMYSGTAVFKKMTGVKVAYAVPTLLDELTVNAHPYKNGKIREASPFSEEETLRFPKPIGEVKAYIVIHSEPATIPRTINKGIKNAIFKIITSSAAVSKLKMLDEVGLTSKEAITIKGVSMSPREFLEIYLGSLPRPKVEKGNEVHMVRVNVTGEKDCGKTQYTYDVINDAKPQWDATASGFVTGVPASIIAQMLARDVIQRKGVHPSEVGVNPEPFMTELKKRSIKKSGRGEPTHLLTG